MVIAVWGRDGVGKSMLCDALGLLLSQKDVAAIIDTDLTQPTLPIRLNGFHLEPDTSLGKAVSGIGSVNASSFLHQHQKHKGLFYAGLVDGDDYMSYEAGLDADETAQDFVEQCSELADTVILDLSGQRTDPFLPGTLLHADKVIVLFAPDLQGICWYQSVAPLLRNRQTQGLVLPVAAMTESHHDIPAVEKAIGASFAATLPFAKEFRQTHDSGMSPLEGATPSAIRYQRQVRQLSILVSEDIQYFLAASKSSDLEYAKTIRDLQNYMISVVNANPTMRSAQEAQLKNTLNYEIINI